jgi:hypothetical protein
VFDSDARRAQGPVLFWIDRLLQTAPASGGVVSNRSGIPKDSVARNALFQLLRCNQDMFSICVDRCYDADSRVATGYFQVRAWACPPLCKESYMLIAPGSSKRTCSRFMGLTPK